jgi:hypothetical protein
VEDALLNPRLSAFIGSWHGGSQKTKGKSEEKMEDGFPLSQE